MRPDDLVLLLERKDAPVVGQGMDDDGRVLPSLHDLVEIADGAGPDGERERPVVPDRAVGIEEEAADEIGGGHVLVAGHGDQRTAEAPRHVFDEAGLAATRRPLQHHGHACAVRRLEQRHLAGGRPVVGFLGDAVVGKRILRCGPGASGAS